MNPNVLAALIGLSGAAAAAFFTALWTTGGRAALMRRTMRQELDVYKELPNSSTRRELGNLVQKRVDLYLVRMLPIPQAWHDRREKRLGQVIFWYSVPAVVLTFVALIFLPAEIASPVSNVLSGIVGVLVGMHFGLRSKRWWAKQRLSRFEWAKRFLEEVERERNRSENP